MMGIRKRLREREYFNGSIDEPNLKRDLDLVAIGTIADSMPLLGVNRILVYNGLKAIPITDKKGLLSLLRNSGKKVSKKECPRDSQRKKQQKLVTEKTILQMKEVSNKFDTDFVLMILDWSNSLTKDQYELFFKKNKIQFVNCSIPLINEMVLLGNYHPSKKAHTYYNECLVNYIKKQELLF